MFFQQKRSHYLLSTLGLGGVIAFCDQLLKWYLPGREIDLTDVLVDLIGCLLGAVVVQIIATLRNRLIRRKRK